MRVSLSALVLLGLLVLAGEAATACELGDCQWDRQEQITAPDKKKDFLHDEGFLWSWACSYNLYADHVMIRGYMGAGAFLTSIYQVKECNGDAKFTYQLKHRCCTPKEDIECSGRCRFTVEVQLEDREYAGGRGLIRHYCSKITSDYADPGAPRPYECMATGGLEMDENVSSSTTIELSLMLRGTAQIKVPVRILTYSPDGDSMTFRGVDGGSGGTSPCVFLCDTNVYTRVKARDTGGLDAEHARAEVRDACNDLDIWLTCDGCCRTIEYIDRINYGY